MIKFIITTVGAVALGAGFLFSGGSAEAACYPRNNFGPFPQRQDTPCVDRSAGIRTGQVTTVIPQDIPNMTNLFDIKGVPPGILVGGYDYPPQGINW